MFCYNQGNSVIIWKFGFQMTLCLEHFGTRKQPFQICCSLAMTTIFLLRIHSSWVRINLTHFSGLSKCLPLHFYPEMGVPRKKPGESELLTMSLTFTSHHILKLWKGKRSWKISSNIFFSVHFPPSLFNICCSILLSVSYW